MYVAVNLGGALEEAVKQREKEGFTRTHILRAALWQYLHLDERRREHGQ